MIVTQAVIFETKMGGGGGGGGGSAAKRANVHKSLSISHVTSQLAGQRSFFKDLDL